ncbi:hypothetical protein DV735_g2902, partial [Chaetothyriales sp. CBS 134920]
MLIPSFLRSVPWLGRSWKPLNFSNSNSVRIPLSQKIEEETLPDYLASRYYPARIGQVFRDRYQIVGKLGYGASSTAWLARDMSYRRYVTLKIFIQSASMRHQLDNELQTYKRMDRGSRSHPGRSAVRSLLDTFDIDGPEDKHRCLVHPPLWESVLTFLHRNPIRRLPAPVLDVLLKHLFMALDFLHTECQIIHTDIKADNIMFGIADDSVFSDFEDGELHNPCPRKELSDGRTIYLSRELRMPKAMGAPVLCDFGSAVPGGVEHLEDIQPDIYRAPEVILEAPWTYSVDIWNVGCMIWNIFEGGSLFTGQDPEFQTYRSRAHLAEIIKLLGPPPPDLLARGNLSEFLAKDLLADRVPLEQRETTLEGDDKASFLRLVDKMLQWDPTRRSSAKELQQDEWIWADLANLKIPQELRQDLLPRSILVRKLKVFPIEAIVRGYITGSAWSSYSRTGQVNGLKLPEGLQESQELPQPLYTPSTKAELGQHDENISVQQAAQIVGEKYAARIEQLAIQIYTVAKEYAKTKGIIIADTKFEFGLDEATDQVVLIDEVLTPDSSRFWPAAKYQVGRGQDSFDKQFLRDWLTRQGLKGKEGVEMPQDVVDETAKKYAEAFELLTGQSLQGALADLK